MQALHLAVGHLPRGRGCAASTKLNLLDIGGGFPAPYDENVRPFEELARTLNAEFDRLFPTDIEILAEPGRFLVATAATSVVKIIGTGRPRRQTVLLRRRRRVSHLLRHHLRPLPVSACGRSRAGRRRSARSSARPATRWIRSRWPRTCRELQMGDLLYSENIGAYSHASSTWFNGFPPAKVLHLNK